MTRARTLFGAVPQPVWTAVAGLALLASLAVAAVIGAGLSVWRGAVGNPAENPRATLEPPGSGLVLLPGGQPAHVAPAPRQPVPSGPSAGPITPVTVPVASTGQPGSPVTGTPVPFFPRVPEAGGQDGGGSAGPGSTGSGSGGFGSRVGELTGGESESHAATAAHAAHLRHEARLQQRYETKQHHAKHARHAKHVGKHAAGKHPADKHRGGRHHADD